MPANRLRYVRCWLSFDPCLIKCWTLITLVSENNQFCSRWIRCATISGLYPCRIGWETRSCQNTIDWETSWLVAWFQATQMQAVWRRWYVVVLNFAGFLPSTTMASILNSNFEVTVKRMLMELFFVYFFVPIVVLEWRVGTCRLRTCRVLSVWAWQMQEHSQLPFPWTKFKTCRVSWVPADQFHVRVWVGD